MVGKNGSINKWLSNKKLKYWNRWVSWGFLDVGIRLTLNIISDLSLTIIFKIWIWRKIKSEKENVLETIKNSISNQIEVNYKNSNKFKKLTFKKHKN